MYAELRKYKCLLDEARHEGSISVPSEVTLSSLIEALAQGLPCRPEDLLSLLVIRDLLPGTTEVRKLIPTPTVPWQLQAMLDSFPAREPTIELWTPYPMITAAERDATDAWDSRQASDAFVSLAQRKGIRAKVMEAGGGLDHCWVRLDMDDGPIDVDWTARRFHDLRLPHRPLQDDVACPLVWLGWPDHHPAWGNVPYESY